MSVRDYSVSDSDISEPDNTYCIFLHIVEGIGLFPKDGNGDHASDRYKGKIILNTSLNGVKFEVEGHCTETSTLFNSNCIWECELEDIKRMKTDNRPVKLECFMKPGRSENLPRILIGSILLPMRGLQTVASPKNLQLKLHWHKLIALNSDWRHLQPEIYLILLIVKKSLVESGDLEVLLGQKKNSGRDVASPQASNTMLMLHSSSNIYVQLLEQVGLIQVGNNPDVDCDIFKVSLTIKVLKHVDQLLGPECNSNSFKPQVIVFNYDFLGSTTHVEVVANGSDCYAINERLSITFKSSLKSLRDYCQRIFYIPINLYFHGVAIASCQFDFSRSLPPDGYFNSRQAFWMKGGIFNFDRFYRKLRPGANNPLMEFMFEMQLSQCYSKSSTYGKGMQPNDGYAAFECDTQAGGDLKDLYRNAEFNRCLPFYQRSSANAKLPLSSRNVSDYDPFKKTLPRSNSEPLLNIEEPAKYSHRSSREVGSSAKRVEHVKKPPSTSRSVFSTYEDAQISQVEKVKSETLSTETQTDNAENAESQKVDAEECALKIVKELEAWKEQQMQHFVQELGRKETDYLAQLQEQWEQERSTLQKRLQMRIAECEEMNSKLERAYIDHVATTSLKKTNSDIAETIKNDIEHSYSEKFAALEMELKRLKTERRSKSDDIERQQKELELQNGKLEKERSDLKTRVAELETSLSSVEKTHLSAHELKEVLNDLRVQTERLLKMEKSKNYYKEQWTKATRDLHKIKLSVLQQQETSMRETQNNSLNACIEEILTEDHDTPNNDRTDLKSIKETLFNDSDLSSNGDFEFD